MHMMDTTKHGFAVVVAASAAAQRSSKAQSPVMEDPQALVGPQPCERTWRLHRRPHERHALRIGVWKE